jgi:hypothetical protein
MDHLSWKLCAAAGFTCMPTQPETIAIAILEGGRMTVSQAKWIQLDNAKSSLVVPVFLLMEATHLVVGKRST